MPTTIPINYSHKKISLKEAKLFMVGAATFILIIIFLILLAKATWYSSAEDLTEYDISISASGLAQVNTAIATTSEKTTAYKVLPAKLKIPALNIEAKVQHVGVSKSGRMAVPTNYKDVGWYRGGTIPGNLGSAVFDGHVDDGLGLAGVFKYLGNIQKGDEIIVEDNEGRSVTFSVESIQIYDYKTAPADEIFHQKDKARIRLITCQGSWVKGDQTYSQRLVVTGVLK